MLSILLITLILVAIAVSLLCIRIILQKGGKFPNTHVSGNKALTDKGLSCHTSQHYDAQHHKNLADRVREQEEG